MGMVDDADNDKTADGLDIVAEIRALSPQLSGQLMEAADFLIAHPEDVAFHSMREIARRSDVTPVTLVRFAQRLGLSGYSALRQRYIEAFRDGQRRSKGAKTRNVESAKALLAARPNVSLSNFADSFFAAEHEVLSRARAALTEDRLRETSGILASASRVFVVGRRTAYPAAFTLAYALRKARPGVSLLDGVGGAPEGALEDIEAGDAFVAVTFAPFNRLVNTFAHRAAESKARIIAITDTSTAPLRKLAGNRHFVAQTLSHAFPESVIGAVAIANLLAALTIAELGVTAQKRIRANERFIVGSNEYLLSNKGARRARRSR